MSPGLLRDTLRPFSFRRCNRDLNKRLLDLSGDPNLDPHCLRAHGRSEFCHVHSPTPHKAEAFIKRFLWSSYDTQVNMSCQRTTWQLHKILHVTQVTHQHRSPLIHRSEEGSTDVPVSLMHNHVEYPTQSPATVHTLKPCTALII